MSLLKESIKRGVPMFFSAGVLLTACGTNDLGTNLVDCNNGPKSNSVTIFLKEGQSVNIVNQPIRALSNGGFQIVHNTSASRPDTIQIDQNRNVSFKPTRANKLSPERYDIYTVSGKAAINGGISGTELTIKADCETPQPKP